MKQRFKSIGLTGAPGVGKTTLGKQLAKKLKLPLCETNAKDVLVNNGMQPGYTYPVKDYIYIQELLLFHFEEQYESMGGAFIADRTPIDLLAFLLAEITRQPLSKQQEAAVENYIKECLIVSNRYFESIYFLSPALMSLDDSKGQYSNNYGYHTHLSSLIRGLLMDEKVRSRVHLMPKEVVRIADRANWIHQMNIGVKVA